jgi:hypothetical protein
VRVRRAAPGVVGPPGDRLMRAGGGDGTWHGPGRGASGPGRRTRQVLVRTRLVGICGTDVAVVGGGVPVRLPAVMGHEMVGEVVHAPEDIGSPARVTAWVVDPSLACGACDPCRRDLKHLCVNGGLMGRDRDGCFADPPGRAGRCPARGASRVDATRRGVRPGALHLRPCPAPARCRPA